jgi:hypothetical protein
MNGKVLLGAIGSAVMLAGALWWGARDRKSPSESGPMATRESASARSGLLSPGATGTPTLETVRAIVRAKNALEPREADAFRARGWTIVSAPPPDARLVALDPALVRTPREAELRAQIASTSASPADVPNLTAIARATRDAHTRFVAVEALGRAGGREAQRALRDLLLDENFGDADDPARRQLAALLRPTALDDPWAAELAALLDARALAGDAAARKQIAFTLALVGLRDGMALAPEVLARLSPDARALVQQMTQLAVAGGTAGSSHHDVGPLAAQGGPQ